MSAGAFRTRMSKGPGGGDQAVVEADQDQGPPQRQLQVGRVVSAEAVRGGQPIDGREVEGSGSRRTGSAPIRRRSPPGGWRRCGGAAARFAGRWCIRAPRAWAPRAPVSPSASSSPSVNGVASSGKNQGMVTEASMTQPAVARAGCRRFGHQRRPSSIMSRMDTPSPRAWPARLRRIRAANARAWPGASGA